MMKLLVGRNDLLVGKDDMMDGGNDLLIGVNHLLIGVNDMLVEGNDNYYNFFNDVLRYANLFIIFNQNCIYRKTC